MKSPLSTLPTVLTPLLNTKQAAALLGGISVRHVQNLVQTHQLRALRIGRRVLFQQSELARFIDLQAALAA